MASAEVDVELIRRKGFAEFVRRAWPQVVGDDLVWEPHMDLLCAHYEAIFRNEIRDLVVNVPPGTSKSSVSSILFPAWAWTQDPALKFMYTTYDQDLSHGFARQTLELVTGDWFQARWPSVQIERGERANVGDYSTSAGGRRISTMMGGAATGKHAHILFVDDPHKPDDLDGDPDSVKAVLDEAWSRWVNTFSKRRADAKRFRRVCIMQRLHEEDLAGRMLRKPGTVHLCLPMEFEVDSRCVTPFGQDWRQTEGELLCPLRFPREVVEEDRVEMTPRAFAAQHQQRPAPAEGALFKREWFKSRWMNISPGMRMYMSIDTNMKDRKDSDYCVVQVWGVHGAQYWLIDQIKGQWSFGDSVSQVLNMRRKWPQVTNVLIETKANGEAVLQSIKGAVPGVLPIEPLGGKMARAEAVEWLLRAGDVVFPNDAVAPWMPAYVEAMCAFPVGKYDDEVDATTQFLTWISKQQKRGRWRQAMKAVRAGAVAGF